MTPPRIGVNRSGFQDQHPTVSAPSAPFAAILGALRRPSRLSVVVVTTVLVLLLLLATHVWRYLSPPQRPHLASSGGGQPQLQILQAPASAVTAELLSERRPLVVEDAMVDPTDLLRTVFRWQYVRASGPEFAYDLAADLAADPLAHAPALGAPVATKARFTLLYFPYPWPGGQVTIGPKRDFQATPEAAPLEVAVSLSTGRVLVLPPGWLYASATPGLTSLRLDDPVSLVFHRFLT